MKLYATLYVVSRKYNKAIMNKITNLMEYKHALLKKEGKLKKSRGLIDEEADIEDITFELEGLWDIEPDHGDLGFVMRKNAKPELVYVQDKFCQFVQCIKKDGKETVEVPDKNTPLHQCILMEYTGTYEAFYDNGSLELSAEFKNGLLHGKFIHFNTAFKKIREYDFYEGEKHGLGTLYIKDDTGRLASVTSWCHGLREGEVLRYAADEIQKITTFSYKGGKLYEISK